MPSEEEWNAAEAHYLELSKKGKGPKITSASMPTMTAAQALYEIRKRSQVGAELVQAHKEFYK